MSKKMFVGNLSFQTTEDEIRTAFERFGSVESVRIITDRDSGRSKGFGFVEMDDANAETAISEMSGASLGGRSLTVNEAKPLVRRDFVESSAAFRGGSRYGDNGARNRFE
jgi:RNA recognition motif-containing protein